LKTREDYNSNAAQSGKDTRPFQRSHELTSELIAVHHTEAEEIGNYIHMPMAGRPHKLSCSTTTALVRQTTVMPTVTLTEQAKSTAATEHDDRGSKTSKLLHRERKNAFKEFGQQELI